MTSSFFRCNQMHQNRSTTKLVPASQTETALHHRRTPTLRCAATSPPDRPAPFLPPMESDARLHDLRHQRRRTAIIGKYQPNRPTRTPSTISQREHPSTNQEVRMVTVWPRAANALACFQHCSSAPPRAAGGNRPTSMAILTTSPFADPRQPGPRAPKSLGPGHLPATSAPRSNAFPHPNGPDTSPPPNRHSNS